MEPKIIYEDENFIAVDKPAGLLVHGAPHIKAGEPTLADWLLAHYPEVKTVGDDTVNRPGIVHRLDKDTSGIMIIPRSQAYFEYLKKIFQAREIKKQYLALVLGTVKEESGVIDKPIGIKTGSVKRSVHSLTMQKPAVTEYRVRGYSKLNGEEVTLLEITPKTGRTHQIRIHLASIGHPVVGDALYGPKNKSNLAPRQLLHAESLEFNIAPGKRIKLSAELPDDFRNALNSDLSTFKVEG